MPDFTLQMRVGPPSTLPPLLPSRGLRQMMPFFAQDVLGMFPWKLPLQLVCKPKEKISVITSGSLGEPKKECFGALFPSHSPGEVLSDLCLLKKSHHRRGGSCAPRRPSRDPKAVSSFHSHVLCSWNSDAPWDQPGL